ncbi:MAG TPA: glycosyltransferase family 39 protein [Thermomicrobiales bacterium]|nr:glycosyltransferase family 39 protein [Thermomicrobiales bacterium]
MAKPTAVPPASRAPAPAGVEGGERRPTLHAPRFTLHAPRSTPPVDPWLWPILAAALALRLAVWWLAPHAGWLGDEREYYSAAAILADGRGFAFIDQSLWVRPPLYVVLLGGLFRVFGPGRTPVWLAQVALSTATVGLVYALGRLAFGRRAAARTVAALCAVYLPFAVYCRLLLSETLFNFLFVGACVALVWHARRGGRWPLVLAGLALGLGVLTRGIALPFLAAVPVWFVALYGRRGAWRRVAASSAVVVGVALVAVAPWTARNALAYHRLVPVDTTGGYNFWLGAMDGRNAGQIADTLGAVPNQGDRQLVAYRQGWDVVRADPGAYLAKSVKEFGDLWTINFSANERLLGGFSRGVPSAAWLALTLALDDLLYLAALPLAVVGWAFTRRREVRWLLGLWFGYTCLTGALFFAISRFRLPLLPFVFLLAARGVCCPPGPPMLGGERRRAATGRRQTAGGGRQSWQQGGVPTPPRIGGPGGPRGRLRWLSAALLVALIAAFVDPSVTPGLYAAGVRAAGDRQRLEQGYDLLARGQPTEALTVFERLPAGYYARPTALATAYHLLGRDDRALATLDDAQDALGAALLRGDIARARGDTAEAARQFNARDVRIANPTDQAWDDLFPALRARLDIGDGLDLGYLRGFNLDERDGGGATYRWTEDHAEVRLLAPAAGLTTLRLRLRGYRPAGAFPPVRVSVNGHVVGTVAPGGDWQVYALPVTLAAGGPVVVRLDTATFVPGYADERQLGVMVDWVELVAVGAGR